MTTASTSLYGLASARDLFALTKPRVVQLIGFCAAIGMLLAVPGWPDLPQWGLAATAAIGIWLVASARTVTAMVWLPALPPTPATIGISVASATIFSIVFSKMPMMVDVTSPVSKWVSSQRTRAR